MQLKKFEEETNKVCFIMKKLKEKLLLSLQAEESN